MTTKPIVVITIRSGMVQDVNATAPVTVFVEDWDCPPDFPGITSSSLTPIFNQRKE